MPSNKLQKRMFDKRKTTLVLVLGLLGSLNFYAPEKYLITIRILTPDLYGYGDVPLKADLSLHDQVFTQLKESLSSNKLILNLTRHGLKKNPGNFVDSKNIKTLFENIILFFLNTNEDELSKYKNSLYYFENGLNYDVHLEIRCISIFNAFEILDESRTVMYGSGRRP